MASASTRKSISGSSSFCCSAREAAEAAAARAAAAGIGHWQISGWGGGISILRIPAVTQCPPRPRLGLAIGAGPPSYSLCPYPCSAMLHVVISNQYRSMFSGPSKSRPHLFLLQFVPLSEKMQHLLLTRAAAIDEKSISFLKQQLIALWFIDVFKELGEG